MAEVTLAIGAAAVCGDGFRGELKSLVVDPASRAVTHLVVEPEREHGAGLGLARLVPLHYADASAEPIRLACTEAEFKDLSPAEETLAEFVPGYGAPVQLLPPGEGWRGADGPVADGETIPQIREMETIPLIPETEAGTPEVEESRADHVRATDGDVGRAPRAAGRPGQRGGAPRAAQEASVGPCGARHPDQPGVRFRCRGPAQHHQAGSKGPG